MCILCVWFMFSCGCLVFILFVKQKTAYEMRISDWSSDVCSSDLDARVYLRPHELDEDCLRIADTMVWFAAWHVSLRDDDAVRSAVVPVSEQIGRASCRDRVCQYV